MHARRRTKAANFVTSVTPSSYWNRTGRMSTTDGEKIMTTNVRPKPMTDDVRMRIFDQMEATLGKWERRGYCPCSEGSGLSGRGGRSEPAGARARSRERRDR
jgi:hypothetical protein